MANKPANAKQKQWMKDIAEWAGNDGMELLYAVDCPKGFQLHHVLGRSAKHNKVAIGHEFIIPVPFELHDVNESSPYNVTHFKHEFTRIFGDQRNLYDIMCTDMIMMNYEVPPFEVYQAIMDTRA